MKGPTLAEFDTLLEAHALMETSEKHRNKSAKANMTKGPQKKTSQTSKVKLTEDEKKRRRTFRGKCYRCGAGDHMIPQCKLPSNVTCHLCKSSGYIANVCHKSSSARASFADSFADSSADSGQLQLQYSPSPTPAAASSFYVPQAHQQFNQPIPELPMLLAAADKPGQGMIISCLSDTSCTQSIVSADLARQIGAHIDTNASIQL